MQCIILYQNDASLQPIRSLQKIFTGFDICMQVALSLYDSLIHLVLAFSDFMGTVKERFLFGAVVMAINVEKNMDEDIFTAIHTLSSIFALCLSAIHFVSMFLVNMPV